MNTKTHKKTSKKTAKKAGPKKQAAEVKTTRKKRIITSGKQKRNKKNSELQDTYHPHEYITPKGDNKNEIEKTTNVDDQITNQKDEITKD